MKNKILLVVTIASCIFLLCLSYMYISPMNQKYTQEVQFEIDLGKARRTRDIAVFYAEADSIRMSSLINNHKRLIDVMKGGD